jgi:hypothetical protein
VQPKLEPLARQVDVLDLAPRAINPSHLPHLQGQGLHSIAVDERVHDPATRNQRNRTSLAEYHQTLGVHLHQ